MPEPVTPPADSDDNPDTIASHLEAAKAAGFGEDSPVENSDKPASDESTSDKSGDESADKKASVVDSVLKKGADKPDEKLDEKPDEVDTKDIDDVKENDWKSLKAITKEERTKASESLKRVQELETQLEEAKKTSQTDEVSTARIRELEEREKLLSDRLKSTDLRSHPEFEEQFIKPEKEAIARAKAILEGDEVEDVDIDELLSLKGREFNKKLDEVSENMTRLAGSRFISAIDAVQEARANADEALKGSEEFLTKANERIAADQRAAFDSAAQKFESGIEIQTIPDDADEATKAALTEYNAAVSGMTDAAAKVAFSATSNEEVADMALKAQLADLTINHVIPRIASIADGEISTRDSRISELEAEVKRLTAASPEIQGSGGGDDEVKSPESHLGAAKAYTWS
jgi:hypothetical protein